LPNLWECLLLKHFIKSIAICLVIACAGRPCAAGPFDDGAAAYQKGDYDSALKFWLPLAERNDAKVQYLVGLMYHEGHGVAQDHSKSVEWFRKSAERGVPGAQVALGKAYMDGEGIIKDYRRAAIWFEKAARAGNTLGMMKLALLYAEGKGFPKDMKQANFWLGSAALKGDPNAQYFVGLLMENGDLVTEVTGPEGTRRLTGYENLAKAYAYYLASAAQGHKDAHGKVESLRTQFTKAEIEQAEKEAAKIFWS
jgi:TPR repeat protein